MPETRVDRGARWLVLGIFAASALAGAGTAPIHAEEREPAVQVGERAPDVELELIDGSRKRLSEVAGEKATLLYFMATW